ncbi:MAG: Sua5/YciO/YrdC/YwlC family protein, partial [Dialister sp.]|nr:Sua5/YciO/YrdC/YwlC family protein [Dialister sp.]
MLTYRITALGRVQGVGFRPLICRLAGTHHITGTVRNEGGVVTIIAQGSREDLLSFMEDIRAARPPVEVAEMRVEEIAHAPLPDFRAIPSGGAARAPLFPADLGICEDCQADMKDPKDHHYGYPYTSCTACGPRYTMIEALPYDRERTAMKDFPLCKDCEKEYKSLSDRRCHAESIACAHCGPQLKGWTRERRFEKEAAMAEAIRLAKEGAILLVKAMGGYQLVCRGDRKETAGCLRRMKHRSGKPFALMMKDIDMAKAWAMLSEKEIEMLTSPVRPILLASPRRKVPPAVASRVPRLGLCLPSTGFYS